MNIRSILPKLTPLESRIRVETNKEVNLQQSTERDANERHPGKEPHPERALTEEEIKKALQILSELPGLQEHSLQLRLISGEKGNVILVEGPQGEIVRRLTDHDLWQVLINQSKKTGQFLDKNT